MNIKFRRVVHDSCKWEPAVKRARASFQAWLNTEYKVLRGKIKTEQSKDKGDNGRGRLRTLPLLGNGTERWNYREHRCISEH